MSSKFELITDIYNQISNEVVRSPYNWQSFLSSVCHNYRLRFDEQLLVYAQRPDATAVLETVRWNSRFNRWVNRGAKGIAVFSESRNLKYYFDISDTHETKNAKPVPVWQYKEEYAADVIETLENSFGELEDKSDIYNAVLSAADNVVEDNISDYQSDLLMITKGSFLEELDDDIVSSIYKTTVKNSVAYMLLSRLGMDADDYFSREDLKDIVNFNTPDTLNSIGYATSDISETVLYEISKTVKSLEIENRIIAENDLSVYTKAVNKNIERSADYDRTHLQNGKRLSDTKHRYAKSEEFDLEQIWADEEEVPQRESQSDLLQSADIGQTEQSSPFENAEMPDSFFDAVVGNVPFGDLRVTDKRYDKNKFLIHDYFFAKSIDKLRPGGIMCLVTSQGTMDKENTAVRKYIAQRADLLGAIRLPNNTFKGNAGTEVTSDILILQKRDRMVDIEPEWVQLDTDENGIRMNKYFVDNPDMVLGEMVMKSGRFGEESTCKPSETESLESLLDKAVSNIKGEITDYYIDDVIGEDEEEYIPADPDVRNFSFTVVDGKVYYRENSLMRAVNTNMTAENRIKGMIAIHDCLRTLIEMQTKDFSDFEIQKEQEKLNSLYDNFTKKYGLINSRGNSSAFCDDSAYYLLCSLEIIKEGKLERKADIFTKRTIQPHIAKTHADTSTEALGICIGEKAKVDMDFMCQLTGKTEQQIFEDLKGVIFLNPMYKYGSGNNDKYLTADEYLSGNVREKLDFAKRSAKLYPDDYTANVEALEKVQPVDLTAAEISVQLGANWIPIKYMSVLYHLMNTPCGTESIEYNDNRISMYVAQAGKCAVSGLFLDANQVDCHHKIPKCYGGDDSYQNPIIVSDKVHILIHFSNERTIKKYLGMLKLNKRQMSKLNKLRTLAQMPVLRFEV